MVDSSKYIALRLQKEQQDRMFQLKKQEQEQERMAQILENVNSLAQGLYKKSNNIDSLANVEMNKLSPPRAEAVNKNDPVVKAANSLYGGPSKPHKGGLDELKLYLDMDDRKGKNISHQLTAQREARLQQQADDNYNFRERQQAMQAAAQVDKNTKEKVSASNAYYKNKSLLEKSLAGAQALGDFDSYNSTAQDLQALHYGNVSAGLKLPEIKIPPFRETDPQLQEAINTAKMERDEKRKGVLSPGGWGGRGVWWNGKTGGQEYMDASNELINLQKQIKVREVDKYIPDDEEYIPNPPPRSPSAFQPGQILKQGGKNYRVNSYGITEEI